MMTPEDKMNLILGSKRTMTTFFDEKLIMKNVWTTFTKNDKLRRNFIRDYGGKLKNVKVNVDRQVCRFLKMMLPNIPNVEQLSVNLSESDARIWQEIQPRTRVFNLPELKMLEVFKPVDLKIIMSFVANSIKNVKYSTEECDLTSIAEYLGTVESLECIYPTAAITINPLGAVVTLDSIITMKIGIVHCGSIRHLRLPNIKSIEIDRMERTDKYLRPFFESISSVEDIKINAVIELKDIPDIIGEVVLLPLLKTFSLSHAQKYSIIINVEEQRVELSDHIHENCQLIMRALSEFPWYEGE